MNIKDLKTGMRIITKNGDEYIVLENVKTPYKKVENMYISKDGGWMSESSYNEDLTIKDTINSDYDIMEVYVQNQGEYIDGNLIINKVENMDLIWKRNEHKKEMTISEIEKELGYSIKIVKED